MKKGKLGTLKLKAMKVISQLQVENKSDFFEKPGL
jgi:hypothetical protein